jgi:hypothetical protein
MEVYTVSEITEMADTWANYNGFTGETCGVCEKTANVLAGGAGWFCDCGHYNVQSLSDFGVLHEQPDMGTLGSVIVEGHKLARVRVGAVGAGPPPDQVGGSRG